jgi:HEPN domain-containing protein
MAHLDLERAERLLKSARSLFDQGDLAGVAGLAYQAFESAIIALSIEQTGVDPGSHTARRQQAEGLVKEGRDKIDLLWEIRNVDCYGNPKPGEPKREVSRAEVEEALRTVEEIIQAVKRALGY